MQILLHYGSLGAVGLQGFKGLGLELFGNGSSRLVVCEGGGLNDLPTHRLHSNSFLGLP